MKLNRTKSTLIAGTFVALMFISGQDVIANGSYGSDVTLEVTTPEVHETVDAGLADMLPQIATSSVAFTGLITTTVLLKKTK